MTAGLAIAVASVVVGKLGVIAAERVVNEASLVISFRNDFQWLERELTYMSGYLQAAEDQSAHNSPVQLWLSEVSDIYLDAEDIVDECAVQHFYTTPTQSCVCRLSQAGFRYKMGKRIKDVKERMRSAMQKAGELNLVHQVLHSSQPSSTTPERERKGSKPDSVQAVAVKEKVEDIERLLEDPAVGVVAVLGMGGLGKTFLVQHLYERIKHRYEYSAWISVSQTSSIKSLHSDLAFQIKLQIDGNISEVLVSDLIFERLEGRKCLIVLDDVWKSSVKGDFIQRVGLPSGRNRQCKTVVTTRERDVAAQMRAHVYEIELLSEEDSWNLFCMFAFPDCEGNKPPGQLENLAHQIVRECGRLPLAVKTVAASMASCWELGKWQSKVRQLKEVVRAEDSTMQILRLSYHSLPPFLKAAFAYFSFFPEDTRISFSTLADKQFTRLEYLIYLWMAEGLIPQEQDIEQFDIGLSYLQRLQNLCLLEENRMFACYTIHDLLRDLVINISKVQKCEFELPVEKTSCRRLLLPRKGINTNAISKSCLHGQRSLRTISLSQNPEMSSVPEHLFDRLKVLRVLDLSSTVISTLPECVGKLKLLKVLNLSRTKIREVPDCVKGLKNLQFLDVSYCTSLQRVPHWIGKLQSLSHLDVLDCSEELKNSYMPKGISNLEWLRTLRSDNFPLPIEEDEFLNVKDIGNLINLQEIRFLLRDERVLRSVEDGILDRLVKMRILVVVNDIPAREGDVEESNLPAFPEKMNAMTDLYQLVLCRFSVPSWICGTVNLTQLTLVMCSGYSSLQNIPNLKTLHLGHDSRCRELSENFGESGGFPKLVRLFIVNFPLLEELPALEEGAMQCLERLVIENCPQVKKVPEGLERLSRLKRIEVLGQGNDELEARLKEGGEDWNKIKAKNPHIIIF